MGSLQAPGSIASLSDVCSVVNQIEEVLSAHATYTEQVQATMQAGTLQPEEIDVIRRDDRCRVGLWLHRICEHFDSSPEFLAVCAEHSRFHNRLANIAQHFLAGERESALTEVAAILSLNGGGFHDILGTLTNFLRSVDGETQRMF